MEPEEKSSLRKVGESFRAEGLALAIPMVLMTFPVSGALIGRWLGNKIEVPSLMIVGLILGLVMGIREAIRLIRKLNGINNKRG